MKFGRHDAYGSLDAVFPRSEPSHARERYDEADGSVTAHAEIPDIIEKDNCGRAGWIAGGEEKSANNGIGSTRFVDDGGTEMVEGVPEKITPMRDRAGSEVGSSPDNDAGRFASGV
jgi:hypothetical protein